MIYRSADTFERITAIDVVAFDKTGTLTTGEMALDEAVSDDDRFLQLVASVEAGSGHPIGEAVAAGARDRGIELLPTNNLESIPGKGVNGTVDGLDVTVGTAALMDELCHLGTWCTGVSWTKNSATR